MCDIKSIVVWYLSEFSFISLELNKNDYFLGLFELIRSEEEHFINVQNVFFKHLKRDIKYCNNIFKDDKTCKELGKQISYKKSLKDDELLDMYRKRYLSLTSSVSHYGTEKAIEKFENYKKDGAVMKKKYLNTEISGKDFRKWIENTK